MSRPGALQFLMAEGQRVWVIFATITMYHPMHIHGHTFQLGQSGPGKDTVIVRPGQQVACDFDASNPGQWMTHCHNLYHAPQGGMMTAHAQLPGLAARPTRPIRVLCRWGDLFTRAGTVVLPGARRLARRGRALELSAR